MLVLSWHFRAATMCEYSRDEFVSGMLRLRCDSIPKLQQRLPELRRDLQDPQKFKVSPTNCPTLLYRAAAHSLGVRSAGEVCAAAAAARAAGTLAGPHRTQASLPHHMLLLHECHATCSCFAILTRERPGCLTG